MRERNPQHSYTENTPYENVLENTEYSGFPPPPIFQSTSQNIPQTPLDTLNFDFDFDYNNTIFYQSQPEETPVETVNLNPYWQVEPLRTSTHPTQTGNTQSFITPDNYFQMTTYREAPLPFGINQNQFFLPNTETPNPPVNQSTTDQLSPFYTNATPYPVNTFLETVSPDQPQSANTNQSNFEEKEFNIQYKPFTPDNTTHTTTNYPSAYQEDTHHLPLEKKETSGLDNEIIAIYEKVAKREAELVPELDKLANIYEIRLRRVISHAKALRDQGRITNLYHTEGYRRTYKKRGRYKKKDQNPNQGQ